MARTFQDTFLFFQRSLRYTVRSPIWVMLGLFQPLCWLLLFAPVLRSVANTPGFPPGGALNVFTPGLLALLSLYSSAFAGFGLMPEIRAGVLERFQVTPVSRTALLLGRTLAGLVVLLVQAVLLIVLAIPLGLTVSVPGAAAALVVVLLLGLMMSSLSYRLALIVRDEDTLAQVLQFFTLPLTLLSGVTLPLSLAPEWLQRLALLNPLAHAVTATRGLFAGRFEDPAVWTGIAVVTVLALAAQLWATQGMRKATA